MGWLYAHTREQPSLLAPSPFDSHVMDEVIKSSGGHDDPPVPPGVVLPRVFGDAPPREGPFDRSSVWVVRDGATTWRHEVQGDTLHFPVLRDVLRLLFAGAPPTDRTPAVPPHSSELLRIEWREHGQQVAVSQLFEDGTLVREEAGEQSVDRLLGPTELQYVRDALRAGWLCNTEHIFSTPFT